MAPRRNDLSGVLAFAERSDAGRRRSHNEDRVASDPVHGVAVLADGMGGHKGGEVASGLVAETLIHGFAERLDSVGKEDEDSAYAPESVLTRNLVTHANSIVHETARTQPQYEGMGTTLVVLLLYDDRLTIGHVATRAPIVCAAAAWNSSRAITR